MRVGIISLYGIENSGVRYLSSVLKNAGHETFLIFFKKWINNNVKPPTDKEIEILVGLLQSLEIGLVGIGFGSPYFKIARRITCKMREALQVPIVWGGIHATITPEECIKTVNLLCRGEGEKPLLELVNSLEENKRIDKIQNLWVKKRNMVEKNKVRPLIPNLDSLPLRDFGGEDKFFIENEKLVSIDPIVHNRELRISASRGCPFRCSYCYNSTLREIYRDKGTYYRIMGVDCLMKELKNGLKKIRNVKRIKFDDDTFYFFGDEWVKEFCYRYKKEINVPFEILLNPGVANEELLIELKNAGLDKVQVGIQGGSEKKVEQIYERTAHNKQLIQTAYVLKEHGIEVVYDIIFDNPVSTWEEKKELLDLLLNLPRPYKLYLYSLTFFPKTHITEEFLQQGIIKEKEIEGKATKSFTQFRLNLNAPRPDSERFWVYLISLCSKNFFPKKWIKRLSQSNFLVKNPIFLQFMANLANFLKIVFIFFNMVVIKREMSYLKLKEYGNIRKILVQ